MDCADMAAAEMGAATQKARSLSRKVGPSLFHDKASVGAESLLRRGASVPSSKAWFTLAFLHPSASSFSFVICILFLGSGLFYLADAGQCVCA